MIAFDKLKMAFTFSSYLYDLLPFFNLVVTSWDKFHWEEVYDVKSSVARNITEFAVYCS